MTSFDSVQFTQLSADGYPTWPRTAVLVIKKIPGGSGNVVQRIGTATSRLSIPALMTAAQASAMLGKVGTTGSLAFEYETTTATLEAMEPPVSIGIDNDLYTSSLSFRRGSAPTGAAITNAILLQNGTYLLLEDGSNLLTE